MSYGTCAGCAEDLAGEYCYAHDPARNDGDKLCKACAVAAWPSNLHLFFNYGVPKWARDAVRTYEVLEEARRWFSYGYWKHKPIAVHYYHRREAETIQWMSAWEYRSRPSEPYSYRGWCEGSDGRIVILVDETETPESILWITWHEIAHAVTTRARMFDTAMEEENKTEGRKTYEWKDDVGHEADSEERLVNRVATAHMQGKERARPWWRPRVVAKQRGYAVLPDAFAPEMSAEFELFCHAVWEGWASPLPIHGLDLGPVQRRVADLQRHHGDAGGFSDQAASEREAFRKTDEFRRSLEQKALRHSASVSTLSGVPVTSTTVVASPLASPLADPEE